MLRADHAVLLGQVAVRIAREIGQERGHRGLGRAVLHAGHGPGVGLPVAEALAGPHPCFVVMPLRLGMRFCTSAMFLSDSVKFSGTTSPRFSR
jgi:hypothetical protein